MHHILIIQLVSLINKAIYFYSILLVIYALLSWFPGAYQSFLGKLLRKICEPYLSMFDHLRLQIGPIDFTIAVAIILLDLAGKGLTILLMKLI